MQLFDPSNLKTHDFKREDFEEEEIKVLSYDASSENDISVEMTVAFRDDKLYILECTYE